jgi:hypothetical protein
MFKIMKNAAAAAVDIQPQLLFHAAAVHMQFIHRRLYK